MFRTLIAALALSATPAFANIGYKAEPVAAPQQARLVLRDVVWKCGADGCVGGPSSSRPAIVCAVLAREVGALRSFSAGGQPLAAPELEKCNARAN